MKNVLYIVMPLSLVFLSLLFIYFKSKINNIKTIAIVNLIFLYLFSTDIGTKMISDENYKDINNKNLSCDVVTVLGGNMIERLFVAAIIQKKFNIDLIASGGVVINNLSEAELYKNYLVSLGVESNKIILENNSKNTFENAKYSSEIIKENGYSDICLVTSTSHINRSKWSFKQFNMNVKAVFINNSKDMSYKSFIPSAKSLYLNTMYIYEYIGIMYYKVEYGEKE